jgi:hypothetical protein
MREEEEERRESEREWSLYFYIRTQQHIMCRRKDNDRVNNIKIYFITVGRQHNKMQGKLLFNSRWVGRVRETN